MVRMDEQMNGMLFLFLFCAMCIYGIVKPIENYDKAIKHQKAALIKVFYPSEEALTNATKDRMKTSKVMLPILLFFMTIAFLIMFVMSLSAKVNSEFMLLKNYTFIIGVVLVLGMIALIVIGVVKKERVLARENIRKYSYIYLNILLSFLLIVR